MEGGLTQTMLTLENALSAPGGEGFGADPGEPAGPVASVDGLGQALAIGELIDPGGRDAGAAGQREAFVER